MDKGKEEERKGSEGRKEGGSCRGKWGNYGKYVWVIDQAWGQDGWILASFFFLRVYGPITHTYLSRSVRTWCPVVFCPLVSVSFPDTSAVTLVFPPKWQWFTDHLRSLFYFGNFNPFCRISFQVMTRMNILVAVLCLIMGRPYQFYYFVPLVSFWFVVIYAVTAAWPRVTAALVKGKMPRLLSRCPPCVMFDFSWPTLITSPHQ